MCSDDATPRLLELNLGDEEAWEIGLTCGGTIEVFMRAWSRCDKPGTRRSRSDGRAGSRGTPERAAPPSRRARRRAGQRRQAAGARRRGTVEGTLGDPRLDARFAREARRPSGPATSRTASRSRASAPSSRVFAPPAILAGGRGQPRGHAAGERWPGSLGFRTVGDRLAARASPRASASRRGRSARSAFPRSWCQ